MIAGLLATKVVSAAVSTSSDPQVDLGASLDRAPIPGVDTLTETDRNMAPPQADSDGTAMLPLLSTTVRAASARAQGGSTHRARSTVRVKAVARVPAKRGAEPVKAAAVPCRQLDPIARFLVSANAAPRCQG
ncbi:conserved hypothetical protein [Bradyrhizobium sp. STM 3843]|nr:conserved hypothetical protein [Bradyrhizobium sp. STM 3843]